MVILCILRQGFLKTLEFNSDHLLDGLLLVQSQVLVFYRRERCRSGGGDQGSCGSCGQVLFRAVFNNDLTMTPNLIRFGVLNDHILNPFHFLVEVLVQNLEKDLAIVPRKRERGVCVRESPADKLCKG